MGYILKNNTQGFLITRLTDVGRQKISEGNFNISYFQLGDSEVNYTADTSTTANLYNLNVLEPAYTAHNLAGVPQSTKNEVKYPYFLDTNNTITYGIPLASPVIDSVFNVANPLGFFTADTTNNCLKPIKTSGISYNTRYKTLTSQFDGTNVIQVAQNGCVNPTTGVVSANTLMFAYLNSNGVNENCGCETNCAPILTYRIVNNTANQTFTLDRPTPYFNNNFYSSAYNHLFFYRFSASSYDVSTPFNYYQTLNQDVINYESICTPYDGYSKIWNMNIPWSENPAGVNAAGGPTTYPNYTSYKSANYLSTKEYFGYQSSHGQYFMLPDGTTASTDTWYYNSSGEKIYVEPEEQKVISIIHYSNNSIINYYGEKFATEPFINGVTDGEARHFKITLPTVMWHKSNSCSNLELYIDPPGFDDLNLFQPSYILSKKNSDMNSPGIRYFHLYDTNANSDGYPSRVGKVFPDDKLIIIDDEELITSISYASNRNYTLPSPKLTLTTPTASQGLLSDDTTCLWVSYVVGGVWNTMHCNYYSKILPLSSCTVTSQDVSVTFDGDLFYMKNWSVNNTSGWAAQTFAVLAQTGTTGNRPQPNLWKRIDFTTQIQTDGNFSGGYINNSGLLNGVFKVTQSNYLSAPYYNLANQISIPTISQLNSNSGPLCFGDESFFYGYLETDIQATIYQMKYLINLPENQFVKPSNPSWTTGITPRMTEVGLYDTDKNLLVLTKFQSPVQRLGVQQIEVKLDF
jgi:hypothetical protein